MSNKRLALVAAAAFTAGAGSAELYDADGNAVRVEQAVSGGASAVHSMRVQLEQHDGGTRALVEAHNRFPVPGLGIEFQGSDSFWLDEDAELEAAVTPLLGMAAAALSAECTQLDAGPCTPREVYVQRGADGGPYAVNVQDWPHQVVYVPEGQRAAALEQLAAFAYTRMCARDAGFCP